MITEKLVTPAFAMKMLGIGRDTLDRMVGKGALNPVLTMGGHRRFSLEEIHSHVTPNMPNSVEIVTNVFLKNGELVVEKRRALGLTLL